MKIFVLALSLAFTGCATSQATLGRRQALAAMPAIKAAIAQAKQAIAQVPKTPTTK